MMAIGVDGEEVQVKIFKNIDDVISKAKMINAIIITKNNYYLEYIANDNQVKAYHIVKALSFYGISYPLPLSDGIHLRIHYEFLLLLTL